MKKRFIPLILLVIYLFILIKVLVFKDIALIRIGEVRLNFGGTQEGSANLIPFKSILPYILGEHGFLISVLNLVGNIVALVPLGFLMPFIYSTINWKRIFVLAVLAGLLIETIQALFHIGIFDIDDVILNGLGVIIGFWKYNLYTGFSISIKKITSVITFTILGSLFTLYFIASFKIIQLPFGLEPSITKQKQLNSNLKDTHTDCCDLCNGTGGTGGIIAIGDNDITIKRRDGKQEIIKLSNKTIIKNSAGPIAKSDLRIGDRVTLVINDAEIASLILVCGIKN